METGGLGQHGAAVHSHVTKVKDNESENVTILLPVLMASSALEKA